MDFKVGMYIKYMDKVWVIDSVFDDMIFIMDMDSPALEVVFPHDFSKVEVY